MTASRSAVAATAALMFAFALSVEGFAASSGAMEKTDTGAMEKTDADELATPNRDTELQCLATAIYHEARGEPERGQLVVGRVILNRVASRFYPNTVCDVVYQNVHLHNRCQFSFACDGVDRRVTELKVWQDIQERAEWLLDCQGDIDCQESKQYWDVWGSTHYHADYVHPFWADKILRVGQIGRHIFYYTATM